MQANNKSYTHSPLQVSLLPRHSSELWRRPASKSVKSVDRVDALTELAPAHSPPATSYAPASVDGRPVQTARPAFGDGFVYINREQSLLRSYRRVLEQAQDETQPLLERIKFLSIVGSNLAEFFMVRVAGIKQQIAAGIAELSPDGLTPAQRLVAIRPMVLELMNDARECLGQLLPKLDAAGIHILAYAALDAQQRGGVQECYDEIVFPALTPMAYDPGRPFPHISNMSLNLAILLRDPQGHEHFARVEVPHTLERLMPVKPPSGKAALEDASPREYYFVWLEQVIAANLSTLFPGMEIVEAHPFRVTRDAELLVETEAEDLLVMIEQSVRRRRFGSVTRVTANREMPERIREILIEQLDIAEDDIYTVDPPLGMSDLMLLHKLDRPDLKDRPFIPVVPAVLRGAGDDIFAAIRHQDILLHHPYDSFTSVQDFLRTSAVDPNVGREATDVFNYLTGYSTKSDYRKFLVSPINLRAGVRALIQREIDHQQRGERGHLIFQVNALIGKKTIQLLYQASQAGVRVDLIVRGMCSLRPGVEGLSGNIRVISIVGQFLEHSRVYYFRNGGREQIYLVSADLMPRNLDRRVEILFPLQEPSGVRYLRDQVLPLYLADTVKARYMLADATYRRAMPEPGAPAVHSQMSLVKDLSGVPGL